MHLGLGAPSTITMVTYTLPPVTIGDDHSRPGISCNPGTTHLIFSKTHSKDSDLLFIHVGNPRRDAPTIFVTVDASAH